MEFLWTLDALLRPPLSWSHKLLLLLLFFLLRFFWWRREGGMQTSGVRLRLRLRPTRGFASFLAWSGAEWRGTSQVPHPSSAWIFPPPGAPDQRPSILNKVAGEEKPAAEKNINKISEPLTYHRRWKESCLLISQEKAAGGKGLDTGVLCRHSKHFQDKVIHMGRKLTLSRERIQNHFKIIITNFHA